MTRLGRYRKSYSIPASSPECRARRSMVRDPGRGAAAGFHDESSQLPTPLAAPRVSRPLRVESRPPAATPPRASPVRAALGSRSVPARVAEPFRRRLAAAIHGARYVNSSRASWHCRAKARAHHGAWLSGAASRLRTTPAADVASRSRQRKAAASVDGRESTRTPDSPAVGRAAPAARLPQRPREFPGCRRAPQTIVPLESCDRAAQADPAATSADAPARFPLSTVEM